jgi:hypothetical protein
MSKEVLSVYDFGQRLIETRDLDPVYVVLWEAKLDPYETARVLVAYSCFYHLGTASWIMDQADYWGAMERAAASKEWPRGTERRHFRGVAAAKAVSGLRDRTAWALVKGLTAPVPDSPTAPLGLATLIERVGKWPQFGPWIGFKVADMLERLAIAPIAFMPSDIFRMYEAPRKGAEAMAERHGPAPYNVYLWAYNSLKRKLGTLLAPPRFERTINIQEIETILCKWKSHLNGHYPVGKDTHEIREHLERFDCRTAKRLHKAGSSAGLW